MTHIPLQAPLCQAIDYMVRQADVFHESSPQAAGARVVEKRRFGLFTRRIARAAVQFAQSFEK